MSSRFSPKKKNSHYEPAAIIAADDDDRRNDTASLTSTNKQSKKNKKQSYVMISTSFDDEDDEETSTDNKNHNNNISDTNGIKLHPLHSTNTKHKNAEETDQDEDEENDDDVSTSTNSEDHLEEIQLNYSPNNNGHDDDDDDKNDSNLNLNINNSHRNNRNNGKNKYGLSAYYGVRLNYDNSKCHDVGWAILWILHCIALMIVLVIVWTSEHVHMPHASNGVFILLFLLAFAVIFAFGWTFLLKYCGGFIVWVLILGNLIFQCAFATFCFIVGDRFTGLGVIFSILFVLFVLFTLLIRKRISYTIALLQLGSSILVTTPSALMVAFGVLITQIFWMFIWGSIVVAFTAQYYHIDSSSDFNGILFILIISFIWNHLVIKNIGHTTICAITAHWYFSPNSPYPTCRALLRCLTTSLGSIVFGSLFIDILQGIRSYLRVLRDEGWFCQCQCGKYTLNCCLSGFDGLLEYFNTYAFVHVAVYNTAYLKSGKNTFDLLSISRIYQLMNSNFTEYALLCGSICGGIINGILASYVANTMLFSADWVMLFTAGGFMIGMSLSSALLNAVSSCVVGLLVLYAEEPKILNEMHPEQYLRFDGAKKGIA